MSQQSTATSPSNASATSVPATSSSDAGTGHYAAYEEHARTLRTWLVAYGIGGPVLIISQDSVWQRLTDSGSLPLIAGLFLGGVVLQVVLAAINKSAMWAVYFGEIDPEYQKTRRYTLGLWLSERYAIDFFCDVAAMGLFAWATYESFIGLIGGAAS